MTAYYNDNDPYCAQWLRNLIAKGLIAPGDVDERSIKSVHAADLKDYKQCHFFAGIGGWSLALRMAGVSDEEEVWTGSCPCQPFSIAGKNKNTSDERHLFPIWKKLIAECRPAIVFGEQTPAPLGRKWLARVHTSLENLDYQFEAADLCAAGVAAPHRRQRLWFVAHTMRTGRTKRGTITRKRQIARSSSDRFMGNSISNNLGRDSRAGTGAQTKGRSTRNPHGNISDVSRSSSKAGYWSRSEVVWCIDEKFRRVEPGTFPVAHGVPKRVAKLRALGNSIVPQVAAKFIEAALCARY